MDFRKIKFAEMHKRGCEHKFTNDLTSALNVYIYRYDGVNKPRIDKYILPNENFKMVLDILIFIKDFVDQEIVFRKSCREGVCGSCAMNINGQNRLACITNCSEINIKNLYIFPLPGFKVIKDVVVDLNPFYDAYKSIKPWIVKKSDDGSIKENIQTKEERAKLDGLYECILCGCCSSSCPTYWWNEGQFLGPAALLQALRFIKDSRDEATEERLIELDDMMKNYQCHFIMNCTAACPKNLSPSKAISEIRRLIFKMKACSNKLH